MPDISGSYGQQISEVVLAIPNASAGLELQAVATGANSSINATLFASANVRNYLTSIVVSGLGATAAGSAILSISGGINGSWQVTIPIPAGATTALTPFVIVFNRPIPAANKNQSIVVNLTAFGAGNTSAVIAITGYQA